MRLRAVAWVTGAVLAAAALCACKPASSTPVVARAVIDAGASEAPMDPRAVAHPAARCAECHGQHAAQWKESGHAQAGTRPTFVSARAQAPRPRQCDRCHAPLEGKVDSAEPAVREGVTCEVCHTLQLAQGQPGGGAFTLNLLDNVKLGPLCDAKDHYFHKMGCSPLHDEAELCAACHLLNQPLEGGGTLPVYTEYDEWKRSEYPQTGISCQGCHLDVYSGEAAVGAGTRTRLHKHGFLGGSGKLRQEALKLKLRVESQGTAGGLRVMAQVENTGAGHSVPSGFPGKRVELIVRAVDKAGAVLAELSRVYARTLENAKGEEAHHALAVRVREDNRISAGETRVELLELEVPPSAAGALHAELVWVGLSPALAAQLGQSEARRALMVETKVPFGPGRAGGGRALLPRTVEVPK